MNDLVLQYAAVGTVATEWDEQHVRLAGGAGQVADVPTGAFTPQVASAAAAFCVRWAGHLSDVGREAEQRADELRDAVRLFVHSDASSLLGSVRLMHLLEERR